MAVAVGLRRDAVGVVGDDRASMRRGQLDHGARRPAELFGKCEQPVAHDRGAIGRVHVLAGAAGMQQGDFDAGLLDHQRFEGDDGRRTLGAGLVAGLDHPGQPLCQLRRQGGVQQPLVLVDDGARLVHLAEPEELVSRRALLSERRDRGCAEHDRAGCRKMSCHRSFLLFRSHRRCSGPTRRSERAPGAFVAAAARSPRPSEPDMDGRGDAALLQAQP